MKVLFTNAYKPNFKAHFYDVNTKDNNAVTIKTDNKPYLGKEPYFVKNQCYDLPMSKDNGFYSCTEAYAEMENSIKYSIHYKDTDKIDDNHGKLYKLDAAKLARKATIYDKKAHSQPLINIIAKGKVKGKVVVSDDWNKISKIAKSSTVPLIVMTKDTRNFDPYTSSSNIAGLILTDSAMSVLSHAGAILRQRTKTAVMLYDDAKIDELKNLNGEYASIDTTNNNLEIKKIDEFSVGRIKKEVKYLDIPRLIPIDRILNEEEYTEKNVGAKAYNIKRMRKMVQEGKLQDINIPKTVALPHFFIKEVLKRSPAWREKRELYNKLINQKNLNFKDCNTIKNIIEKSDKLDEDKSISDIVKMCKDFNSSNKIMVRSAFNDEDMDKHSAAGIYDSFKSSKDEADLLKNILKVAASKWNYRACQSRIENNINVKDIDGSVMLQEFIPADYIFNIYTNTSNNLLRIDMKSQYGYDNEINDPYVFSYDKETEELTMDAIERRGRTISFDENSEIIKEDSINDEIVQNFGHFKPLLKKLAKNALKIEQEFGRPQDIEGGLHGDDIYLWQTRAIVK